MPLRRQTNHRRAVRPALDAGRDTEATRAEHKQLIFGGCRGKFRASSEIMRAPANTITTCDSGRAAEHRKTYAGPVRGRGRLPQGSKAGVLRLHDRIVGEEEATDTVLALPISPEGTASGTAHGERG